MATIFLCAISSISSVGQDKCMLSLSGTVVDPDGNGLPGATIMIGSLGIVSNVAGRFQLENLCPGNYLIEVKFMGFEDYSERIILSFSRQLTLRLNPSRIELKEVAVYGEIAATGMTNSSLTIADANLDRVKGKTLGEGLTALPGVNAIQSGPAIFKPVIHGLHSQRILILNNGIRQEGQQWGIEHAPEIDPYVASELSVVKGAEAVRYGADAMGGVVIINTPKLDHNKNFGGELNTGFMSNNRMGVISGTFEGGFGENSNWSWRLQGTGKKGGDFSAPNYVLSNTGVKELNFSGAIGFTDSGKGLEIYTSSFNTEIGILRAAHTGNLTDLENSIKNNEPWYIAPFTFDINNPRQQINHQLLKVKAHKHVGNLGKINFLYGGQYNQRKEYDVRRGGLNERPALFMKLLSNVLDVSLDHEHVLHSGSIGINATYKYNINETGETGVRPLVPDYTQFATGLFIIEKMRKANWLLEVGARYDFQFLEVRTFTFSRTLVKPSFNFHYFSGTLGASRYFSQSVRLNNHISFSMRPPHVSELYSEGLHHGTAAIEEGLMRVGGEVLTDQDLILKEASGKWISTLQITGKKLSADFSVYANLINNYVFLSPTGSRLTIRGYFPVWAYQQTDALLAGADAFVQWSVSKKFQYTGKLSYIYGSDLSRNDVLIFIPPVNITNSIGYQTNLGELEDFFVRISVPIVYEQFRAPITVYPSEIPDYTGDQIYDIAPAPPGYTLINMEAGFKLPLKNQHLALSLAGENLTNKVYRNYMNRLRYFADDTGRNFIIRLTYNFNSHN
ncbi:MAG: TonB-dependent receptor plug domain-containing protein [Cyclobacteriaceae bacterium]|nr:TonB-dependent receptor plug domain-containing protein [Cyclobacteriaceae bacterium]